MLIVICQKIPEFKIKFKQKIWKKNLFSESSYKGLEVIDLLINLTPYLSHFIFHLCIEATLYPVLVY